jgi:Ca2+-binding RTX toxin-like protein
VLRIRDRDDRIAVPDFFSEGAARSGMTQLALVSGSGIRARRLTERRGDRGAGARCACRVAALDRQCRCGRFASVPVATTCSTAVRATTRLDGHVGGDALSGGDGDDVLLGRSGHDEIDGGDGADRLEGGRGDDLLSGGAGDDRIADAHGDNVAEGGDGNDVIRLEGSRGLARGGAGNDSLVAVSGDHLLMGDEGEDTLAATSGAVQLDGGSGDDALAVAAGANAVVHFGRGSGTDVVDVGGFRENALSEVRLGAGIAPADVSVRRESGDFVLTLADSADTLRVRSGFRRPDCVPRISFTDGGSLDGAAILALARQGSARSTTS